jgi:tRNA pseudouridine38-40 synthase
VSLTKFVIVIEYNGTQYHGFQWQIGLPTIQAELEEAIKKLDRQSSRVMAASRTDAGVHAREQVASFWAKTTMDTTTLVKALNYHLPGDIAVKAAHKVSSDFNVRRDAISREYRYYIMNRDARSPFNGTFALFMPKMLDIETMNRACHFLQGEHDLISFATSLNNARSTMRHVYEAKVDKIDEFVIFCIEANSFLPHQVRNTVGLLIRLGLTKMSIEEFCNIMEAKKLGLAGPTAPPHGLWLTKVNYSKPLGG